MKAALKRAVEYSNSIGLSSPILLAPMAGNCPPSLSIAVARSGGMGACGALLMQPSEIADWAAAFRTVGGKQFQMNVWTPDPAPRRNAYHEARIRQFLADWGPMVSEAAGDATPPDFRAQCEAMLATRPTAISSIMGLFPADYVLRMRQAGIKWFATATTVREAKAAAAAGADAIIAQGAEAGGHRGAFDPAYAETAAIGLFSLLPSIVEAVDIPVIAAGGIGDARGIAASLVLGASAAMIGTAYLRCPEAKVPQSWADRLSCAAPEDTVITRAFSGRPGRSLATAYARAAAASDAPPPAPYPVQRGLTAAMRGKAVEENDVERMQAWAGQSAHLAQAIPAADLTAALWRDTLDIMR